MKVIRAPEVAPAAPKQETVASDGKAPMVFAWARGETPKLRWIQSSYSYLAR